jgi:hypothetical protein
MSLSANGQTNSPKEVVDPILTDPSVAVFMKEFSKLMATHFEKLGDRSQNQSLPKSTISQPVVREIGPLHAQAIKNKKPTSTESPKKTVTDVDDNKVQQVIATSGNVDSMVSFRMLEFKHVIVIDSCRSGTSLFVDGCRLADSVDGVW